jgi:hypothetical protein
LFLYISALRIHCRLGSGLLHCALPLGGSRRARAGLSAIIHASHQEEHQSSQSSMKRVDGRRASGMASLRGVSPRD